MSETHISVPHGVLFVSDPSSRVSIGSIPNTRASTRSTPSSSYKTKTWTDDFTSVA
jgi:hypothetical protein